MRNLPSLPLNLDVAGGTFAVWVVPTQGTLMTDDTAMLPNNSIFIIMTCAVEHLLVRNELFHFVLIALDETLDPFRVIGECVVLVLDALDDAGSKAGSIFLLIHVQNSGAN
jgi:hypothetical protein